MGAKRWLWGVLCVCGVLICVCGVVFVRGGGCFLWGACYEVGDGGDDVWVVVR